MKLNKKLDNLLRKQGYIKIPFIMYLSGHIIFELELNKLPAIFLLDTGASGTILTKESIQKYSLQMEDTEEIGTGAGSTNLTLQNSIKNTLTFKTLEFREIDLLVMDLTHVNKSFEELNHPPIDGVLGADILTKNNCVIDYKGMNLYISK